MSHENKSASDHPAGGKTGVQASRVLITGADGFIGRALIERLLSPAASVDRLVLIDQRFDTLQASPHIERIVGDVSDAQVLREAFASPVDLVFHLAVAPTGLAEAQVDLGIRVNIDATLQLLQLLRHQGRIARLVFASSIGVYGAPFPALIDEGTLPEPKSSYGAHKLIGEVLLKDYSRHGFIDGRAVRLPAIVARPAQATRVRSGFMSDLILELAAGRPYVCPVAPTGTAWWMSRPCVIDNLLHAASLAPQQLQGQRVYQLPALQASVADVAAAVARVCGADVLQRLSYEDDPALRAQFASFPPLHTPRSLEAGFRHDGSIENLVKRALEGSNVR